MKRRQAGLAYAFITPAMILFIVFTAIPFVLVFVFAFTDFNGVVMKDFVGWDNFVTSFTNDSFMSSLKNVFIFAACYVPLSIVSSLVIAYLISRTKLFKGFFKILFYMPSLTSGVAMIFVWKELLNVASNSSGIIFNDGYLYMLSIVAISLWSALGGNMLIYLAAMTSIPSNLYEAADIDGAGKWQQFVHITIPHLRPSTYFIFTTTLIGSFQLFDLVYLLSSGKNEYIVTPVVKIYTTATQNLSYGLASAMSVILFVIIMVVTVVMQLFVKENKREPKRRHATKKD